MKEKHVCPHCPAAVSGGFLLWLVTCGFASLWGRRWVRAGGRPAPGTPPAGDENDESTAAAFRGGFLAEVVNSTASALLCSIMPQFIPDRAAEGPYSPLLGGTVVLCAPPCFPLGAPTARRLGPLLVRPRVEPVVEGVAKLVTPTLGVPQLAELVT
ncbi:hypothetical protein [Streptomyces sp. CB03238]|uniref:hypothetical protein n=1 Tax=Streptomyces sp. CB03238 TaxID=1907777 RepID=UPI000A1189F1|nr:hypothetical protein [Streptomyces sp. CB03238]ORT57081.1 hypothetical protein BKD26_26045 [Streptomyces sp. CB03238]